MLEVKREFIIVWFVLATAWLGSGVAQSGPRTCHLEANKCTFDKLNFSNDGLQRLRASTAIMQDVFTVQIDLLISPFPDSTLLTLFGEYVNEVLYAKYHEQFFRIAPACTLSDITVSKAPQMQAMTVGSPNDKLKTLTLTDTGLRSIPQSFLNLRTLSNLIIHDGLLQTVSLAPLANSPNLRVLMLDYNNVTELQVDNDPDLFIPVDDLSLAYNRLEHIDGAFFRPLKKLSYLTLEGNRLKRIVGSSFSFPSLVYLHLERNAMTQLNVSGWQAPRLTSVFMDYNNFTSLPVGLERLPNLTGLLLSYNQLPAIDLSRLSSWPKLQRIDVSNNLLQSVRISRPGRVSLPLVSSVNLANNKLPLIQFARWNMPMLSSLTLAFNELQRVPDLFQLFPKLGRVNAFRNPFRCSALRELENYLVQYKLSVDTSAYGTPCLTSSSFALQSGRVICCEQ